jgi:hypothetical protein
MAGKTHLLEYVYNDLGGSDNGAVFFLSASQEPQENLGSIFSGYERNKHYVVQRAKYPGLSLLSDINPKTTTLDLENVEIDRYKYPYLKALCASVFGERVKVSGINAIEAKLRQSSREVLEDADKVNSVMLQQIASSLSRDANHAFSFFSHILTCFKRLNKDSEFIVRFNNLLLQNNLFVSVEVTGDFDRNGLLKWQLRNDRGQLHGYDGLSSGQQALFNFVTWGVSKDLSSGLSASQMHFKVMLLDEPDIHLDPDLAKQMFAVLKNFAALGVQVIMTTHRTDTVSLASEGSIFTINDRAVIPSTRLHALLHMTKNTRELVNLQTVVYVEGKDVPFYSQFYLTLSAWCDDFRTCGLRQKYIPQLQESGLDSWKNRLLSRRNPLQFIQVPTKGGSAKEANCAEVKNGVSRGYHLGQAQKLDAIIDPRLKIPFGIIDKDNGNTNIQSIEGDAILKKFMVVPQERYSKENFIFDPWVFLAVLSDDEIANNIADPQVQNVFSKAKRYLDFTANEDDRNNAFKEYYAAILGKDTSGLTFKVLKVVYYHERSFETLEYSISEEFLNIPGHELERGIFRLFKKDVFKSGKALTEHAVSLLDRVQAMPQDLVFVFFRLNDKILESHNAIIKPPLFQL